VGNYNADTVVFIVDDGRINFDDFCKLMQQQQPMRGSDTTLPERDTRQVFRVNIIVYLEMKSRFRLSFSSLYFDK